MKRFLCFTLIFILFFNCVVYADGLLIPDDEHTFYGVNTNRYYSSKDEAVRAELDYMLANGEPNFWLFLSTSLGIINSGDVVASLKGIFNSNFDDIVQEIDISEKGQLKFTASTLLKLRNLIEQEMKKKEPYTIYYPGSSKVYYEEYSPFLPKDGTSYVAFRKYFDTFGSFGRPYSSWDLFDAIDFSKFRYAYLDRGYISFVDYELKSTLPVLVFGIGGRWLANCTLTEYSLSSLQETLGDNNAVWSAGYGVVVADTSNHIYKCTRAGWQGSFSGQPIQVFNSLNDLYNYVNSKPLAYYTSNYNNKTYTDITLNQETIKNYTTENVQNIYNTVNNNAGDALSAEELQQIIDSTVSSELDKINGSLGDVNDSLKGVNAALEKILKSLDKSGEELKSHTTWLEKIYKVLKHMDETLLVISSDLDEILEDDGLLDQQTSISSLTAVLNIFLYGVPEPEEEPAPASVYYDDSSGEYVEEPVVLSARYASRSGGGVVGLMFDKFPFCVPWDVYYCFLSLAETPEAPHFTFPFVIDSMGFRYEFSFNLSRFSMLSELSRMFLTLTFVVYMTHLTKKIVGGK